MSRPRLERWLWGVGGAVVVAQALLPVAWLLSLSLKRPEELGDGRFLPRAPSFAAYRAIFEEEQFRAALVNSIGVALLAGSLAISLFPPIAIVGPLFELWREVGLFDTWLGLVIPYMTFTLPLAIWILSTFFREVPWELGRAAILDGATPLQVFRHVLVPLAALAFFSAESQFQQPTGLVAAASVVVTIPVVAVEVAFERRIVAGLTSGAVKG